MIRVNQRSYYRQTTHDLVRLLAQQYELNNQMSSGKRINAPSDDSLRSITAQYANRLLEEVEQYDTCVDHALSWVKQSESQMDSMNTQVTRALALAEQAATGTYSGEQRAAIASEVENILAELIVQANSELNGSHIFSGSLVDEAAATTELTVDNPATPNAANTGAGGIYGSGEYQGVLSRNVTVTVDAAYAGGVPSAANPMTATVSYVDDWGRTITRQVTFTGTGEANAQAIGDGISLSVQDLSYAAGDSYTLTIGRQHGNDADLAANLSWSNRLTYNTTVKELYGAEGNDGTGWNNLLDQIAQWLQYLEWDSTEQDYFTAIPATYNDAASSAELQVSGDWETLQDAALEFNVGGPIQSLADDADLANYRNFTVDAAYAGGVPSADNPMNLNYEYWDGAAWVAQSVVVTGTGEDHAVTLTGGVEVFTANSGFSASEGPYEVTPSYPEGTEPSVANPLTMTYTYTDANGVRQKATVTFTGTGEANAQTLDPPGDITLALKEGSTFDDYDSFALTLEQYGQGQAKSQEMMTKLESASVNLLNCIAEAGAKQNRLEVRSSLLETDVLRFNDRLEATEDVDPTTAASDLAALQTLYEASLKVTSLISSKSLADYL